jgi:hypothetical protein
MKKIIGFILAVPLLMIGVNTVCAEDIKGKVKDNQIPSGWREMKLSEYAKTLDYHYRIKEVGGGLRFDGDLDGDGRVDKVRFLENYAATRCAIYASLNKKTGWIHLTLEKFDSACVDKSSYLVRKVTQDPKVKALQFLIGVYEVDASAIYYFDGRKFNMIVSLAED